MCVMKKKKRYGDLIHNSKPILKLDKRKKKIKQLYNCSSSQSHINSNYIEKRRY